MRRDNYPGSWKGEGGPRGRRAPAAGPSRPGGRRCGGSGTYRRGESHGPEGTIDAEKRYSEEEFALVLRRAMELQEDGPRGPDREGLTLAQMQAIARDVGIDPELVARAVGTLTQIRTDGGGVLAGGPARVSSEHRVGRRLDAEAMGRVLAEARRASGHQGRVSEAVQGVTWQTEGDLTQLYVTLRPDGDGTQVEMRMDRGGSLAITWILATVGGMMSGAITGAILEPASVLVGIGIFATGVTGGLAAARALFAHNSARFARRFSNLVESVVGAAEREARSPALPAAGDAPAGSEGGASGEG